MTLLYIPIFFIGIFFGSFSTLALYRIPLKMDITHERSFCPKCNHKLGFFDLIPVFSYIFLGGKCRYCGDRISPRYLFIELFFGLVSLIIFRLCIYFNDTISYMILVEFLIFMIIFEILFLYFGLMMKKSFERN